MEHVLESTVKHLEENDIESIIDRNNLFSLKFNSNPFEINKVVKESSDKDIKVFVSYYLNHYEEDLDNTIKRIGLLLIRAGVF